MRVLITRYNLRKIKLIERFRNPNMKKNFKRIKDKNGEFKILFDGVIYDEKLFIGESVSSNLLIRFIKDNIPSSFFIPLRSGLYLLRKIININPLKILRRPNLRNLCEAQLNEIK